MTELTRRGLLAASAAATAGAATSAAALDWPWKAKAATPAPAAASWTPDATTVASMIRSKEISAVEAVEAAIRRSEALQPKLNFMVNSDYDRALDAAKKGGQTGPFAGVPFLIKDLNDYAGTPTRNGSGGYRGAPAATASEPWVEAALRAGLIPIGKSASPEFGYLPTTEPLAYGPTRNPWNGGRRGGDGPRHRRRRLNPHPGRQLRSVRLQALARPADRQHRHAGHRPVGRPRRQPVGPGLGGDVRGH
jgi:amidase